MCHHPKSSAAMIRNPITKPEKMRMATRSMVVDRKSPNVGAPRLKSRKAGDKVADKLSGVWWRGGGLAGRGLYSLQSEEPVSEEGLSRATLEQTIFGHVKSPANGYLH